jgi:hypothetical protein
LCMVLCHISLDHDVVSCWCRCVATAVRAKTCAAAVFGSASSSFDTLSSALFALQCTARFLDLLCCSLFAALHAPNPCLQPSSCSVLPFKFLRSTQPLQTRHMLPCCTRGNCCKRFTRMLQALYITHLDVIVSSPLLHLSALPCSTHFHAACAGNAALASYCRSYTTQCRCLVAAAVQCALPSPPLYRYLSLFLPSAMNQGPYLYRAAVYQLCIEKGIL